ncbi:MAG: hypothetical protein IT555_16940 [Acetobacteraceae bacterium]|nr:hypothetical protein [Acetobacteraceae bacterium]
MFSRRSFFAALGLALPLAAAATAEAATARRAKKPAHGRKTAATKPRRGRTTTPPATRS